MTVIGRVAECWRYPVKSFQGESIAALALGPDGPVGDRAWGVLDPDRGVVLGAKRVGGLLGARARTTEHGTVEVTLPDGTTGAVGAEDLDRALSHWLGHPARLVSVATEPTLHQEMAVDNEDEASELFRWRTPRGRYVDVYPLHLLTTAGRAGHDTRRFRPNLLLDLGGADDTVLLGRRIRVGAVEIDVPDQPTERCVMVTRAQPGLPRDRSILRDLARARGAVDDQPLTVGSGLAVLGCYGEVAAPGTVAVGDTVEVLGD